MPSLAPATRRALTQTEIYPSLDSRPACCRVTRMKWLFVISVALAGGCGDREASKLGKIRDEVCHCKTAKCAEAALADIPKKDIQSTPKSQRVAREMLDCLAELYKAERPTD